MATEKRLIDANALMKANMYGNTAPATHRTYAEMLIQKAPTIEAVPVVHGWWIELPGMEPDYKCSECGRSYAWWEPSEAHYCPNCGAKMDGGSDGR